MFFAKSKFRTKMVILAGLEAILGHLGTILGPLGTLLGRSWSSQGATTEIGPAAALANWGGPAPPKALAKAKATQ